VAKPYRIEFRPSAAKTLAALPRPIQQRIAARIEGLKTDPRPPGSKKLKGSSYYRVRVGDYRVIYEVHDDLLLVIIVRIGHRKDVYD
jgi:mRNA interferase RelE/StbE